MIGIVRLKLDLISEIAPIKDELSVQKLAAAAICRNEIVWILKIFHEFWMRAGSFHSALRITALKEEPFTGNWEGSAKIPAQA